MPGWGSEYHRINLLTDEVTDGAVAATRDARGTIWWTMVVARRC